MPALSSETQSSFDERPIARLITSDMASEARMPISVTTTQARPHPKRSTMARRKRLCTLWSAVGSDSADESSA
jgi:hypothetical protein